MDPAIVAKLHDAFKKALYEPDHLKTLAALNQDVVYMNTKDFTAHAREQIGVQADIVKRYKLAAP
jgi:tripartite-type tricarboxylate transporter receptor subunit TctC